MSDAKAKQFSLILKSIMEKEVPPEEVPGHAVDYLVQEGYIEEHGNRKFHLTEAGALLYGEIFLKLRGKT